MSSSLTTPTRLKHMFITLALIPFFTWALADVFGTLASRAIGNLLVNFGFLLFSFLFISMFVPFAGPITSVVYFFVALILGGFQVIGLLTYFKATEIGNASLVGAIVGSFSILVVVLSLILFRDTLKPIQFFGIIVCLAGLVTTSFRFEELRSINTRNLFSDPGVQFAFVTFVTWGLYFTLIRIPVEKIGWFWSLYPATFYFLPLLLIGSLRQKLRHLKINKKAFSQIFLMVFFGRIGDFAYNMALTKGFSSIVGAITGASPVLFIILARFIFKEHLSSQQKIGVVCTMCGILLVTIGSL